LITPIDATGIDPIVPLTIIIIIIVLFSWFYVTIKNKGAEI
jgi:hypothetical protein